ncbi:MAG: TIGR02757 family protein [Bacteroidota bacterium]|jgi:uncharacterized protein (TIGR02757 family)
MSLSKVSVAKVVPTDIAEFLLESAEFHEKNAFIEDDPIRLPHQFNKLQDIEIIGFIVACISWGNRKSIIRSGAFLITLMDNSPYDFIVNAESNDLKKMQGFVHRTFNGIDLVYFCEFLQQHYKKYISLESAFYEEAWKIDTQKTDSMNVSKFNKRIDMDVESQTLEPIEKALINFRDYFFAQPHPSRTEKHISSVLKNSACKRLNMFLRWMIRKNSPVDFGFWNHFNPKDLYLPLDVHVLRVANQLNLIEGDVANWQTCKDITALMRTILPSDPVKLDFALFGIGIEQKS